MITYLTIPNIILGIFLIIFFLTLLSLYKQDKDKNECWAWKQLISEPNGTASQTKMMQLIGSITGTFIVIYQTVQGSLMSEVFIAYLAALGLSAGFSRWLRSNNNYSDRYRDNYRDNYSDRYRDNELDINDKDNELVTDDEIERFKTQNKNQYR